ncbi:MAG: hypothetical protein ACJAZN_001550 [Planctomycetota bacterium]|jgi:hypothetical protein
MQLIHKILTTGGLLAISVGCSSGPPQLPPPPPPPTVATVPTFKEHPARKIPDLQDLTASVNFPQIATDAEVLAEGVTTRPNYSVPIDAKIVISVPVEEQLREERRKESGIGAQSGDDEGISSFKTTGYFNRAEQQIVRSLIGKGFIVLDRSKFEAKLRDQREEANRNYYSRNNEAKDAEIEAAADKKEAGLLTVDQWANELAEIEKKYITRSKDSGRKAGQAKELVDNSELIRAAQSGEIRSDFILQVNTFNTAGIADERLYLTSFKEIEDVCKANPGLRQAYERSGSNIITRPGFFGYLNAKLIDVQTGAIVWVGEHRVTTENVLKGGFTITVPSSKRVSNGEELNKQIKEYNKALRQMSIEATNLKSAIEAGNFQPAPGEVLTQNSLMNVKVAEYNALINRLSEMTASEGPKALRAPFEYKFVVEPVELRPILPTAETLQRVEEEYRAAGTTDQRTALRREYSAYSDFLSVHYSALAKKAAKELIATIPAR